MSEEVYRLQRLGNSTDFDRTVAQLRASDCAPHLVSADALIEDFRYRVEREFARLGNHHVYDAHQIIRGVDRVKDIIVQEYV